MPDMQNPMARAERPAMTDWSSEISGGPAAPAQATAHTSTTTTTTSSSALAAPSSTTTTTMPAYGAAASPAGYNPTAPAASNPAAYNPTAPMASGAATYNTPAPAAPGTAMHDRAASAVSAPVFRNEFDGSAGTLDLQTHQPLEVIEAPASVNEAFLGSLKSMLVRNRGNFMTATFLIGTQGTTAWEGILHDVGNDYLIIYQPGRQRYIACDIYSLKYIEFYDTRKQQMCEQLLRENGWRNNF